MVNDTATVRIPGLSFGGALQVSNTTIVTIVLGAIAASLVGMHFMNGMHKAKWKKKEWNRHSPRAVEDKVLGDVMAFASNIHTVGNNLPQIRNMVHTLRGRIKNLIDSYRAGEITQTEFDSTVRNLYPLILDEMNIPANTVPQHVINKLDASIDRIADKIMEGKIPAKIKFRMYKNHPGLSELHELGRQRALQVGRGHKYGLKRITSMHTNAGIYLKDIGSKSSNFAGWEREPGSYFGAWFRPW